MHNATKFKDLTGLESIRDSHLGRGSVAKHRVELASDKTQPGHCAPYRTVPRAREFEREEINRRLSMKVIELD